MIQASELATFELHCLTHPVHEERCSTSHDCSIRPVWQMLQQRIDEVLESVRLCDLLAEESTVRARVGLPERRETPRIVDVLDDVDARRLPILQG